ncbi:phosphomannomutase/phosphoglucomutase [Calderihabitans maritimus]|uniref:Phosphomannomutase/phosphoglucomutase ManB n=1 Tax=Calderihabitans maritimus TaxID=1246530 RepID=A0A1Z5HXL6_9FIRM|nr:phosphomannomutase/phosphoglucomutase [Calderihabitans maritimus]GAW94020.1 phosphomannomutase/phosphoglucomutase ManB [Calderihabitans maritimus]
MRASVFKAYDIRGKADEDFTNEEVLRLGKALGTYFIQQGFRRVIVGRDNRLHSPRLREAVVDGLVSCGCQVFDIGETITPVFYFAHQLYDVQAGVMITASHNPPEDNGFKVYAGDSTIYGEEIQKIRRLFEAGEFIAGNGQVEERNPREEYLEYIASRVRLGKPLKVVVDCGNGTAGPWAPALYKKMGCQVIDLYCDSDPSFPNHHPDPTVTENLETLREKVLEERADLGLAFDGDGDRLGVIDDKGKIIWGDMLQILFWREILLKYPGAEAIIEVKCSQALVEEVKRLGGKPFFYKTGHSLIKAKMKEIGAVFTGEMSGHIFFADEYFGYDDALYAGARLLRILSESDKPLSELLSDVPRYYATTETRIGCAEEAKGRVIESLKSYFRNKGYDIIDVDGVRVQFPEGWGLVRASNTQPVLVARCEGKSLNALKEIAGEMKQALSGMSEVEPFDWEIVD